MKEQKTRTSKGVTFTIGAWGIMNPDANKACGPLDPDALLPDPQHIECKSCKRIIMGILTDRQGGANMSTAKPAEQTEFNWDSE